MMSCKIDGKKHPPLTLFYVLVLNCDIFPYFVAKFRKLLHFSIFKMKQDDYLTKLAQSRSGPRSLVNNQPVYGGSAFLGRGRPC